MTSMQANNYVAAPCGGERTRSERTRTHAWACDCVSIAFDMLRTVKGDYGSSG